MINKINEQLESISKLKPEWNGRGTKIPSKKCIKTTINIILKYMRFVIENRLEFKQLDLIPINDGGISIEIDTVTNYIEIEICNNFFENLKGFAYLIGGDNGHEGHANFIELNGLFVRLHNERS